MTNHNALLEVEDPILFSIQCEIHRLILKPCKDDFLDIGFDDNITKKELYECFMKIRERFPYLDNDFLLQEINTYIK